MIKLLKKRKGNPWGQIAFLWIFFMCLFVSFSDILFLSFRIFFILFVSFSDILYPFCILFGYPFYPFYPFRISIYPFWISIYPFYPFRISIYPFYPFRISIYPFWISINLLIYYGKENKWLTNYMGKTLTEFLGFFSCS